MKYLEAPTLQPNWTGSVPGQKSGRSETWYEGVALDRDILARLPIGAFVFVNDLGDVVSARLAHRMHEKGVIRWTALRE